MRFPAMPFLTRPRAAVLLSLLIFAAPLCAQAVGDGDGFVATLWGAYSLEQALEANQLAQTAGARQISFLVHLRQSATDAHDLSWQGTLPGTPLAEAPAAEVLAAALADAHQRGLATTLVPFVQADNHDPRATFWPADREAWFEAYGRCLEELARFAEEHGVGELLAGSELSLLYLDAAAWRLVIETIREHFHGHLTISCLWFTYPTIQFWDALDSIGISAYFPLALRAQTRDVERLERSWRLHRQHLLAFSALQGKPLTFSEVGYPATEVAARIPWDFAWAERSQDLELQAACFEAFRRVWSREPRLRRFAIWGLESAEADARHSGGLGFVPLGKPAEEAVRQLFEERRGD